MNQKKIVKLAQSGVELSTLAASYRAEDPTLGVADSLIRAESEINKLRRAFSSTGAVAGGVFPNSGQLDELAEQARNLKIPAQRIAVPRLDPPRDLDDQRKRRDALYDILHRLFPSMTVDARARLADMTVGLDGAEKIRDISPNLSFQIPTLSPMDLGRASAALRNLAVADGVYYDAFFDTHALEAHNHG